MYLVTTKQILIKLKKCQNNQLDYLLLQLSLKVSMVKYWDVTVTCTHCEV